MKEIETSVSNGLLKRWRPSAWQALILLCSLLIAMPSRAIEEPAYTVVKSLSEDIELRDYAPYVVAEVTVPGPAESAGNQAFPILAGYIFGKNKGERKMAMTAPVTQAPVAAEPMRMAMTAPVTQTRAADASGAPSGFVLQFVLPRSVSLNAAPEPLDPRIRLREEPATRWAVIRYSGMWTQSNQQSHTTKLREQLAAAGIAVLGEPTLSRYNGPMTPAFLRRNEIWLRVAAQP